MIICWDLPHAHVGFDTRVQDCEICSSVQREHVVCFSRVVNNILLSCFQVNISFGSIYPDFALDVFWFQIFRPLKILVLFNTCAISDNQFYCTQIWQGPGQDIIASKCIPCERVFHVNNHVYFYALWCKVIPERLV